MKKALLLLIFLNLLLFADIAKVVAIKGQATILRDNKTIPLKIGSKLLKNDTIKTLDNTKLQIIFKDNTIVTMGKNSHFEINEYVYDEANKKYKANFGLFRGTFRTITGKIGKIAPEKFKLRSKTSSIGIRGTQILSNIQISGDTIFCTEGEIEVISLANGQKIELKAGEFVEIKEGKISAVQKFDIKTINTTDSNTKFLPSEEKEDALEEFGVEVNENQESDNTPSSKNSSEPEEETTTTNNSDTYDDLDEATSSTETQLSGYSSNITNTSSSQSDTISEFNLNDTGYLVLAGDANNIDGTFDFKNLETNWGSDNTYSSALGLKIGVAMHGNGGTAATFNSANYTSVKDSFNGTITEFNTDDSIQWGNWNINYTESVSKSASGYWVMGEITDTSNVTNLLKGGTTATYMGYVLAKSSTGATFDASNSEVKFIFDFGSTNNTINNASYIKFTETATTTTIHIESSTDVTANDFAFQAKDTGSISMDDTGSGSGRFYGDNAKSIGGNFKLLKTSTDTVYSGVFKASKNLTN